MYVLDCKKCPLTPTNSCQDSSADVLIKLHWSNFYPYLKLKYDTSLKKQNQKAAKCLNIKSIKYFLLTWVTFAHEIDSNLFRRQIAHSISNLPSEPHQLFGGQIGLRFNIRILIVRVVQSSALSQVSQQVTKWHILNKDQQGIYRKQVSCQEIEKDKKEKTVHTKLVK